MSPLCTPVDWRNNSLVESLPSKMLLVTNFKFQKNDCREQSLRSGFAKKSCWWQISNSNILTAGNNPWSQVLQKSLLVTNFKFQQIDCRCTLVDGNGRSVNKALWLIVDGWVIGPRCASIDRNAWIYRAGCFLLICPNKNLYADQWYWRAAV